MIREFLQEVVENKYDYTFIFLIYIILLWLLPNRFFGKSFHPPIYLQSSNPKNLRTLSKPKAHLNKAEHEDIKIKNWRKPKNNFLNNSVKFRDILSKFLREREIFIKTNKCNNYSVSAIWDHMEWEVERTRINLKEVEEQFWSVLK